MIIHTMLFGSMFVNAMKNVHVQIVIHVTKSTDCGKSVG